MEPSLLPKLRFRQVHSKKEERRVDFVCLPGYIPFVAYEVEYTDEFGVWWGSLSQEEQEDIAFVVELLKEKGPMLRYPYSSEIKGSKLGHLRELRIQHKGEPYRVLYAFDPLQAAILLIGGCKTGDSRFYERTVPIAERAYREYLNEIAGRLKKKKKGK